MEKLQVDNLCCVRQLKPVFANLSFTVNTGEVLLIEGANGSGKSSLLRLLAGISTPASGTICWQQRAIQSIFTEYTSHLHYIGHTNGIKLGLTVSENLHLTERLTLHRAAQNHASVLSHLQLSTHKHSQAKYLSAGQKRRLALAKLFLFPKTLWLLDEPLTALDVNTQHYFFSELNAHVAKGGMAVISSHQPMPCTNIASQIVRLAPC